jgi:hypothetical protein
MFVDTVWMRGDEDVGKFPPTAGIEDGEKFGDRGQHPHIPCLVDIPKLYARQTKGRWKQFSRVGPPIDNGLQILIMSYRIRSIENNKKNISLNLTL